MKEIPTLIDLISPRKKLERTLEPNYKPIIRRCSTCSISKLEGEADEWHSSSKGNQGTGDSRRRVVSAVDAH